MEFPCKPTVDPLMDTWFESGLLAIAPASFKVLGSSGSRTTTAVVRHGGRDHTCHWKSWGAEDGLGLPTVHHLHTAVLISEVCGKPAASGGEVIPTVVVFETRGHSTRDSRRCQEC